MTVAATTARYAFSFSSASPISSFPFVRNALVAGVLISLSAALLGVPLVLKRLSFIGDGLSHVAFGAMAVAGVLNFADSMSLSLPVTIICALVLLKPSRNAKGRFLLMKWDEGAAYEAARIEIWTKPKSRGVMVIVR